MIQAGAASRAINCELGDDLSGQLHRRQCQAVRDDLEANALYLAGQGERLLLVGLDLISLETAYVRQACAEVESATGIPARNVLLCCTHTHTGPMTQDYLYEGVRNDAHLAKLRGALVAMAVEAVSSAQPARIGWQRGAAPIGYNRRLCWADGTHSMYGDSSRADFAGLEGPDDPSHAVLFAVGADGKLLAVVHNNCCHSTCVEGATFVSADYSGEARRLIRSALGYPLPVLYLQGASGDISPWDMLRKPPRYDGQQRLQEVGMTLAAETLRLIRLAPTTDDATLHHAFEDLPLAVRLPSEEELARARATAAAGKEQSARGQYVLAVAGVLKLYEDFKDHPSDRLAVHAVRIGDFALATNPCELYCQFGLDIKRRSPAAVTAVAQLADGGAGYCPTIPALMGGGYSGQAIYWCRLEPYAGYKLVEASSRLLNKLWRPQ